MTRRAAPGSRRAGATARHSSQNQNSRPTASRICQKRPISRYSQPWLPNQNQAFAEPLQDARPLAEQAADDDHDEAPNSRWMARRCPFGSPPPSSRATNSAPAT